jgi:predicted RNA binding protein YcfA (HicA-like mRNA interferase family)
MKRKDLIKLLEKNGWYFKRNGANHDIYTNGKVIEPIPRHTEINEKLAKAIIKKLGLRP